MRTLAAAGLAFSCLLAAAVASLPAAAAPPEESRGSGRVAIIVHPDNHAPDPSLKDLQSILTLQRQFWGVGRRIVVLLPPSGSPERQVLLQVIYHTTDSDLRRQWARRLFAGEIPAIPLTVREDDAAVAGVRESPGAIAAVPAQGVPPGVRVLLIDGKRPGDPGYPLILGERH